MTNTCVFFQMYVKFGLELARSDYFVASKGDRSSVPNVIIMITDGMSSNHDPSLTPAEQSQYNVRQNV